MTPADDSRSAWPLTLGVDAGSSGCRAALVDRSGSVVGIGRRSYHTRRPTTGAAIKDPSEIVASVRSAIVEATKAHTAGQIAAVAFTGPAHDVVLLDSHHAPLSEIITWSDLRPASHVAALTEAYGRTLRAEARVHLGPGWTLTQLAWLRDHRPGLLDQLACFVPVKDWLAGLACGVFATDTTDAAGTAMYDAVEQRWIPELFDAVGLDPTVAPTVVQPGTRIGTARAKNELGLAAGIHVTTGATDTASELVAIGAEQPGDGLVKIATSGTVVQLTGNVPDRIDGLLVYPYRDHSHWYILAATNAAGASLAWLTSTIGVDDLGQAIDQAAQVSPGADGLTFLPYVDGERCPWNDPNARGAFIGLSSSHSSAHLVRAVLEGVACSLADCRDALVQSAPPIADPVFVGRGLRDPVWSSIVMSVLGVTGRVTETGDPSIGAARLAARSVGLDTDPPEFRAIPTDDRDADADVYSEVRARYQARAAMLMTGAR